MGLTRALRVIGVGCAFAAAPADASPPQTFADGVRAVCAGERPNEAYTAVLARHVTDPRASKTRRVLALRAAVEHAGVDGCALLDALTAFEPPPALRAPVEGPGMGLEHPEPEEVPARVEVGAPRVSGDCRKKDVIRVFRARQQGLRYCYERRLADAPGLTGTLELTFRVLVDGKTADASVIGGTLTDATLGKCATRQINRWRFPRPDSGDCEVAVTATFASD